MNFQYKEGINFCFIFAIIAIVCVMGISCRQPIIESTGGKTLEVVLGDQIAIVALLGIYREAMESENIDLFSHCFDREFQSPNHKTLDSLKEETKKFFLTHKEIVINFDNVNLEISIPGDLKISTKTKAQMDIDEDLKHREIQVNTKFFIKPTIKESEAVLSFLCETRALVIEHKDFLENLYYKKEKKYFYLRKKRGEWKIYSMERREKEKR